MRQPGLPVFEVYLGFVSCGEPSEVLLMKSSLDRRQRNMYAYILESIRNLLCSHSGVFFTAQIIFRSSSRLLLLAAPGHLPFSSIPVHTCFFTVYPIVVIADFDKPTIMISQ